MATGTRRNNAGRKKNIPYRLHVNLVNLQNIIPIGQRQAYFIKRAVAKTVSSERKNMPAEITICLVDDKKISKLHKEYLRIDGPTDVIAFNNSETGQIRADIAISADTAVSNAKLYKTSPFREIVLYVIHGTLHICGYEDNSRKNRLLMRKKEERLSAGIISF